MIGFYSTLEHGMSKLKRRKPGFPVIRQKTYEFNGG